MKKCTVCGVQLKSEEIPATGHSFGAWTVVKPVTCTENGQEKRVCSACGLEETRVLPATGHKFGAWQTVKAPTCEEEGLRERTCSVCGKVESEKLPAAGHSFGAWKIIKTPTCEEDGLRERTCSVCGKLESEKLPATGHQHTHWTVTIKPTLTTPGERKLYCDDCGKLLKTETMSVIMMNNNTMCAMGPRLRDVRLSPNPETDLWYMFTPFDASIEGKQTFDLVASNLYVVGTVTLEIQDGMLTLNYHVNSDKLNVTLEFYTILPSISEISKYEPEALYGQYAMRVGEPIDLKEAFGEDTNLVLYFCSGVDYQFDQRHMTSLAYNSKPNKVLINSMLDLMD